MFMKHLNSGGTTPLVPDMHRYIKSVTSKSKLPVFPPATKAFSERHSANADEDLIVTRSGDILTKATKRMISLVRVSGTDGIYER